MSELTIQLSGLRPYIRTTRQDQYCKTHIVTIGDRQFSIVEHRDGMLNARAGSAWKSYEIYNGYSIADLVKAVKDEL